MNIYTKQQILEEFRLRRYLEPVRTDCVIQRTDGVDTSRKLMMEIDQWYANLLRTAPPEWLKTEEIATDVTLSVVSGTGAVTLTLPADVCRVVSLTIEGNATPITPILQPSEHLIRLQQSPFTRGGRVCPVAFMPHPGSITLFAHDANGYPPELASVIAVRHDPEIYQFDDAAWSTVPQITI
ncbi:MAG: hypothetical protein UH625_00680 [Muribaculaceae bacterium]|nr:hypothetical protein [Muribaculaceae bacterium]